MKYKPLLILLGEPYSVFIELFLKTYKKYILKNNIKIPIVLVGSYQLFEAQMKYFNYSHQFAYPVSLDFLHTQIHQS